MGERTAISADTKSPGNRTAARTQSRVPAYQSAELLQRTIGNEVMLRLLRFGVLQAKLAIGRPDDVYAEGADSAADAIMRMPREVASLAQRRKPEDEATEAAEDKTAMGDAVRENGNALLKDRAATVPDSSRGCFEPRFSAVCVHSDAGANKLARSVNAQASTVGRDIVFGAGRYAPDTPNRRQLTPHEMTHAVHQGAARWNIYGVSDSKKNLIFRQTSAMKINRKLDADAVRYADQELWKTYPELKGRKLTTDPADEKFRQEWRTLYKGYQPKVNTETGEAPQTGPEEPSNDSSGPATPAAVTPPFFVCARDLQGILGAVGNHAYIEAPPFRYAIITRCKPTSGSDNVVTGTAATKTDMSPDPCGKTPTCVECVPKPGVTDLGKCLRDAFTAYNDPSMYKGLGPNSNTFAGTVARGCCDKMTPKPKALGNVPGWDDAPASGRAASCPSGPPKC